MCVLFGNVQLYVKKGQLDAKMLGALLTGVNRAFPFLKGRPSIRAGMPFPSLDKNAGYLVCTKQCLCMI